MITSSEELVRRIADRLDVPLGSIGQPKNRLREQRIAKPHLKLVRLPNTPHPVWAVYSSIWAKRPFSLCQYFKTACIKAKKRDIAAREKAKVAT